MSLFNKKEEPKDKGIVPYMRLDYNGAPCTVVDVIEDNVHLEFDVVHGTKCGTDGWYKLSRLNSDPGVQPITPVKVNYKRQIMIPNYAADEWCDAVKKLVDKLGVTYSNEDAQRFQRDKENVYIVVEYNDPDVDAIFNNLSLCDYLYSEILTTDDEDKHYKELSELTGLSGEDLDAFIDWAYKSIPLLYIQNTKSTASNVRLYWDRCNNPNIDLLEAFNTARRN